MPIIGKTMALDAELHCRVQESSLISFSLPLQHHINVSPTSSSLYIELYELADKTTYKQGS
jgi:hypothetical protein